MRSAALRRFEESMNIGYEQWHDGVGYDLAALAQLSERENRVAERKLIPRAFNDWRDVEALAQLGTPRALEAILEVRQKGLPEIRLHAHCYGPSPSAAEWESAILGSLSVATLTTGLMAALRCAVLHPSSAVVDLLWSRVRMPSAVAYQCASALCCIGGASDSLNDDSYRSLFLRLVGPASEDRSQAVEELERLVSQL